MAYITLEELKEILPGILDQWIDEDDEGWEWIFQEIEQKCHVDKCCKGKKWKKKLREDVNELQYFRHNEYEIKVNSIATKVNQLNKKVEEMHKKQIDMQHSMDCIKNDISAVESKAKIAMIRTEIDYSDYSGKKHEDQIIQNVYNRMINRGATREELDSFRDVIKKYDATNVRPMTVNPNDKDCKKEPCDAYQCWEAKDE